MSSLIEDPPQKKKNGGEDQTYFATVTFSSPLCLSRMWSAMFSGLKATCWHAWQANTPHACLTVRCARILLPRTSLPQCSHIRVPFPAQDSGAVHRESLRGRAVERHQIWIEKKQSGFEDEIHFASHGASLSVEGTNPQIWF